MSISSFIFSFVVGILGFFCFCVKLKVVLSKSLKNYVGIFMVIALSLYVALNRMDIFYNINPADP